VGDERLTFVAAEPVYLERQRGVAIHYRDVDGHMLTYVALPAPGLAVPQVPEAALVGGARLESLGLRRGGARRAGRRGQQDQRQAQPETGAPGESPCTGAP
jgi:hypothetical protein